MAIEKSLVSGSMTMLILKLLSEKDMYGYEMFYPQLGVKLCSMAGGGVQKIYMVFLREPSR